METDEQTFDFLTIGSGSGLDVASVAANRGQSVAVVEKGPLGGTCLNRGCIPSKHLLYHAAVLETVRNAGAFGIHAEVTAIDFADIVRSVNEEVRSSSRSIRNAWRTADEHRLIEGEARFVDDHTVEIVDGPDAGIRATADTILIAAGARPTIPPIDGIDAVPYITSTEALTRETPPDRLVIVGGGYIAAELGHFFGTFGSDVTIIGRRRQLLPQADAEVGATFTDRYAERFEVHTGYEAIAATGDTEAVTVEARPYPPAWDDEGGADREPVSVTGDTLLIAAGRRPNSDTLNLEATDVETDEAGFIRTDEYLRTTADGIWALGDIVGEYLLKHNANHEAGTVVQNLFGDELVPIDYSGMPFAVFGRPEVAGVGVREQDLDPDETEYATRTYAYDDTARGQAMQANGFVKVIIDPGGKILGCHIIGPDASTLIEEVVVAMTAGTGTVWDIRDSIHVHPALSEVVERAFAGRFTRHGPVDHDHDHGHDHDHDHGHGHDHEN